MKFNTADNLYSRSCAANAKKQPIIISEEEKKNIDDNHSGSYNEALEYSTDTTTPYYYICPRYWCAEENVSLTDDQVQKDGDELKSTFCSGKIIEFDDKKQHHKGDSDYIYNNPGFNKNSCIPCCFKISQKAKNIENKRKCKDQYTETGNSRQVENIDNKSKNTMLLEEEISVDYIQQPNKFPLEANRFGYLPLNLQKFLPNDLKNCKLKGDFNCILRIGIEQSNTQSFISCLSSIYSFINKEDTVISNSELKKKIWEEGNIDLDSFITYMNGNLIQAFYNKNKKVNVVKYVKNTVLGEKLVRTNKKQQMLFEKCVNAFEEFKIFLKSEETTITHEYIWDIISNNKYNLIFKNPINLVIFEIKEDFESNYIEVLCPTNHYSNDNYKENAETYIILKHGDLYEPIVYCERKKSDVKGEKFKINIVTNLNKRRLIQHNLHDMKNLINNIKTIYLNNDKCGVLPSNPGKYKFKPIEKTLRFSNDIVTKLVSMHYGIQKQIVNYNGKCIGLLINEPIQSGEDGSIRYVPDKEPFMLPIYPSSILKGTDIIFIDDETLLIKYATLKKKLFTLSEKSSNEIPCNPVSKVIDNEETIVGIITETKQFIPVEPKPNKLEVDDYKIVSTVKSNDLFLDNKNLFYSDAELFSTEHDKKDMKTNIYIKKIKLESRFYDCFRNFIRIQINKPNNIYNKEELQTIINNNLIIYSDKVSRINVIIKKMTKGIINFVDYFDEEKISSLNLEENICFDEEKNALLIPSINLVTEESNEPFYYKRLYDEIIRYDYIRKFIFDIDSYLSLVKQNYNLNDDEFILPQSLLSPKYFENLVEIKSNLNKLYDTAYPQIHIPYSNIHKLIKYTDGIEGDSVDEEDVGYQMKKEKKKINRCPNGFRRTDTICVPINASEWNIIEQDENHILYEHTSIKDKKINIGLK